MTKEEIYNALHKIDVIAEMIAPIPSETVVVSALIPRSRAFL